MSTPQKGKPEQEGKLAVDPLKENDLGQIEGGFSEIANDSFEDAGEINGISCKVTNESQCGTSKG